MPLPEVAGKQVACGTGRQVEIGGACLRRLSTSNQWHKQQRHPVRHCSPQLLLLTHLHWCRQRAGSLEAVHTAAGGMTVKQPQLAIITDQSPAFVARTLGHSSVDLKCARLWCVVCVEQGQVNQTQCQSVQPGHQALPRYVLTHACLCMCLMCLLWQRLRQLMASSTDSRTVHSAPGWRGACLE